MVVVALLLGVLVFPDGAARAADLATVQPHDDFKGCGKLLPPEDPNYTDDRFEGCQGMPSDGSMNDSISSYDSHDNSKWVVFYEHVNFGGWKFCAAPNASSRNISGEFKGAEDQFSSHQMLPAQPANCRFVDRDQ